MATKIRYLFALLLALPQIVDGSARPHPALASRVLPANPSPVVYGDWEFPLTLNALRMQQDSARNLSELIFLPLVAADPEGRLVPRLLQKVPKVANGEIQNGGKRVVLTLRHGMRWSSGAPVTNRDVLFGWRIAMDAATGPFCAGTCDHIVSITLKGRYMVVLHLTRPWGPLLRIGLPPVYPHAWHALGGTPSAAAQTLGKDPSFNYLSDRYWSDGPYRVTSYKKDDHITFSRMQYFALRHQGHFPTLIFRFYGSRQVLIEKAASGAVSIGGGYSAYDLKELESAGLSSQLRLQPSLNLDHVEFNVLDKTVAGVPNPVVSNRVRQALALVVDRTSMVSSTLGLSAPAATRFAASGPLLVPFQLPESGAKPTAGNWDPPRRKFVSSTTLQAQDARKLLSQAGFPHGFTLDLHTDKSLDDPELKILTKNWAQIGVRVNVVEMRPCFPCTPFADLYVGKFEAALFTAHLGTDPASIGSWVGSQFIDRTKPRPVAGCEDPEQCDYSNLNFSGIQDSVVDSSLREGLSTLDEGQRARAYWQLQNRMIRQAYWVPLFFLPTVATAKPGIKGFTGHPDPGSLFWNVESWTRVKG